ncbi:MAG: 5-formyltetrahydrofolate cyclo-ligase [Eubacterium sp.]|jgi:5-formyltetrahydrofolate cyclo-ligase|nr:5-formyltetrahydrofolate cyclo-ligase [Eubacterium sp.]
MCFVSFGSEVDTHTLIKNWLDQGKQISVPCIERVTKENKLMHAVRISDFDDLNQLGSFGILEPELNRENLVKPYDLDIIIVPGSVFDINKNRIGYGGGFYDRYLAGISGNCRKIGVCYDFQVVDKVPYQEYDIPLDLLVTENRII